AVREVWWRRGGYERLEVEMRGWRTRIFSPLVETDKEEVEKRSEFG
ncbi:hypothetical protein Tco_1198565, partial [Tanacetum coccineum]